MAIIDEKTKIIVLSETIDVGEADNCIRVEDDDMGDNSTGWAKIVLSSNKASLDSNGVDTAIITGMCRLPGGIIPQVAIRREETTPSEIRKLSTRFWMPPGYESVKVFLSVNGEEGDPVSVESWLGREIITGEDLLRGQEYIVRYWGAYTVTFSVDQLSYIWPTSEVPVFNGIAETYLTSKAEGGGLAVVLGSFENVNDELTIRINDIWVMEISVSPNPGSIALYETSEIIARVIAPNGLPVANGMTVTFAVSSKGSAGTLSSATATTQTDTITDEVRWSTNEKTVSTQFPISSIVSITTEKTAYARDYSPGATFNGNTITLAEGVGFDEPIARVYVTYKSGGIAKTTFSPTEQGEAIIFAYAGQEAARCTVAVGTSDGGSSGSSGGGGGGGVIVKKEGYKYSYTIEKTFQPTNEITKMIVDFNFAALTNVAGLWEYEVTASYSCNVIVDVQNGEGRVIGFGKSALPKEELWMDADDYLHGMILVNQVDLDTPSGKKNVSYYSMQINWNEFGDMAGDTEKLNDHDGDAKVPFSKGRIGTHAVSVTKDPGGAYEETFKETLTITETQYWEAQEDTLGLEEYVWGSTTFGATIHFWLKADADKELSLLTVGEE